MNASLPILSAIIGAIILLFGRKLFWLCVAAVGFAAGVEIAPVLAHEPSPVLALTFALVLGFIGALLALFLQKLAIALVGFLAGGKLATAVAATFFVQHMSYSVITFLIGGIVGAILLLLVFDWALIVLSSVVGAYLIQSVVTLPAAGTAILFAALALLGIVVQAITFCTGKIRLILLTNASTSGKNQPMNPQATGLRVSGLIFALVAIGHLWRLVTQAQIVISTTQIPMWVSVVGVIIAGTLSIWTWRLSARR